MKIKIFIFVLLSGLSFNAQQRQGGFGGGQRQPQNQNRQFNGDRNVKLPTATDVAGIFYYDIKRATKRLKIKDKEIKAQVSKALNDYNFKIKEISLVNTDKLKVLDVLLKSRRTLRGMPDTDSSDNDEDSQDNNQDFRKSMGKIIRPIRQEIRQNEITLNETLENILTEKQNKKWLKYQKELKEKLKPKRPDRNKNSRGMQQGQRGNGQRRGF